MPYYSDYPSTSNVLYFILWMQYFMNYFMNAELFYECSKQLMVWSIYFTKLLRSQSVLWLRLLMEEAVINFSAIKICILTGVSLQSTISHFSLHFPFLSLLYRTVMPLSPKHKGDSKSPWGIVAGSVSLYRQSPKQCLCQNYILFYSRFVTFSLGKY